MATVMAGRLYPHGMRERHSWDIQHLHFNDEMTVDRLLRAPTVDRKARAPEELGLILEESQKRGLPTITTWIHEDLLEVVQKLWEHAQEGPRSHGPAESSGDCL